MALAIKSIRDFELNGKGLVALKLKLSQAAQLFLAALFYLAVMLRLVLG